jgi:hypothetical protein
MARQVKVALHQRPGQFAVMPEDPDGAYDAAGTAAATVAAHEAAADPHPGYTTAAELSAAVAAAVAAVIASAPATLDTLDELAAALGDDPNFATTIMAAIGAKQVAIQFKDEGGNVGASGAITAVNFVGASVTASVVGTVLTVTISASGAGDVVGPASSVDGRMALFDGVTGKLLKQGAAPPVGFDLTTLPFIGQPLWTRGSWGIYSIPPGPGPTSSFVGVNSTAITTIGPTQASQLIANTSTFTRQARFRYTSSAVAGNSGGHYLTTAYLFGSGGWFWSVRLGSSDAASVAQARCFYGVRAATGAPANADPSSFVDMVCVGADSGEANLSIMHNDSAGTATKVALGANFPAHTLSLDFYEIQFLCLAGGASILYHVRNLRTGNTASGTLSTNLPTPTTALTPTYYRNNGATALATSLDLNGWVIAYNLEG